MTAVLGCINIDGLAFSSGENTIPPEPRDKVLLTVESHNSYIVKDWLLWNLKLKFHI